MRIRWPTVFLLALMALFSGAVAADEDIQYVVIADPFIDLHTGPGVGYPVTHVVERGDEIGVIKRRTDWFLVRGPHGKEGWASKEQMELTLHSDMQKIARKIQGMCRQ